MFHFEETICAQIYDHILHTTIRNSFEGMRNLVMYTCCEVVSAQSLELAIASVELAVTSVELAILLLNWVITMGCNRQLGLGDLGERLEVPWGK